MPKNKDKGGSQIKKQKQKSIKEKRREKREKDPKLNRE